MLEQLIGLLGFGLCHQLPERSFFGGGVQVPVCARDTGIYLGFAVALVVLWLIERGRRSSEVPPWPTSLALGALVVLMAIDGVTSYAGLRGTTNPVRLFTGLGTGYALAAFTLALLNSQMWVRPGPGRVLARAGDLGWYGISLVCVSVLTLLAGPLLGIAYPLLVSISILATFTAVNAVLVALLPPFERKATRPWDTWPIFAIALVMTIVELAGAAWLKAWMISLAGIAS